MNAVAGRDPALSRRGLGVLAASMTAFYSWRLLFMTFHGTPRADKTTMDHVHESPRIMLLPLLPLALGAVFVGAIGYYGLGMVDPSLAFWNGAITMKSGEHHGAHEIPWLVVHLPLIVPPNCEYRVGFERRQWQVGQLLCFDDTIEHEARNDSDELRVVLIFDVWNPLLSAAERDMVRGVSAATREFHERG